MPNVKYVCTLICMYQRASYINGVANLIILLLILLLISFPKSGHICMYVHTYICMYVCTYVHIYECTMIHIVPGGIFTVTIAGS